MDLLPTHRLAGRARGALHGAGLQHGLDIGKGLHALQRADGRKDDEKVACLVLGQGICRANPFRLELFSFVSDGNLALSVRHPQSLRHRSIPWAQLHELGDRSTAGSTAGDRARIDA